ncbi:MAG: carboxypeptidase-like regulatory domain-containing protein [Acidobacteriaceae bacterium]
MEIRKNTAFRWVLCALLLLPAAGVTRAQDINASLGGTVTDTSGAAIPNAQLTLTNVTTTFKTTQVTSATGEFNFTNLTPGNYSLSANATGFQSMVQSGIELTVNQQGRLNLQLKVGNTQQTVTVTGDTSTIDYTTPTLEGTIAPETLQDFPLIISGAPRSSVTVADMMPGVSTGASGNAYNTRINGGLVTGDEAVVDGATAMEGFMNQSGMVSLQTDFGMSPDITSEVTVLTLNYGAQYGNTTSGQLIIQTRSGGDHLHGAAFEYLRNNDLNALQYGAPRGPGVAPPVDQENEYGVDIGGPIWLPFVRTGGPRLKGFFYFNWTGYHDNGGTNSATLSVLSSADRSGNFGAAGSQLYYPDDPAKYGADAGTPIAYQGVMNQINPAYEDPVAAKWIAALPTPTSSGEVNNYFIPKAGQGSLTNKENVYFARVDVNAGANDHLYYSTWFQYTGVNSESNLPVSISTASPADPENANIERFNWEHNFSGTMNNHATLGYLNRNEGYFALNGKANLPMVPGAAGAYLPEFTFGGGYTQLGDNDLPTSTATETTRGTWAFNDVFTKVLGSHTLNAGFEWRLAGTSIHEGTNQGGTYYFSPNTTGNAGCAASAPCPGDAAASFYLGAVANATETYYNVHAEYPRQTGWAIHGGDEWRVNNKLTLDYSLRWDYVTPFREKYDNLSFFDPNGTNPGAVTTSGAVLQGRLAFAGTKWGAASYGAPYPEIPFKKGFAPRVGFAYSLTPKTVIRAGYGIYFGQAFYPGWNGGMSQDGFNKNVNLNQSPAGNFQVPALYLNSGITPTIYANSIGSTAEDISGSFDNGQSPLYRPLDGNRRPYSSQWNFTIQKELPSQTALTLSYVGTKGTHLPSSLNPLNVLDPFNPTVTGLGGANLSTSYTAAGGPAAFAAAGVAPPYVGWASQMTGCAPTMAQALLPYPQYCSILQGQNEGHADSLYNSFQAEVERRLRNGIYVLGSLTVSKLYTNSSYSTQSSAGDNGTGNNGNFSPYAIARTWALAPDNVPIGGQISAVYELPFGANRQFLSSGGAMNAVVGGWSVSPLFHYEYGTPLYFSSSNCPTSSLVPQFRESCVPGQLSGTTPLLHGRNSWDPTTDGLRYLNPNSFESNFSAFGYTGFGKAVSTLYGPDFKDFDASLIKDTKIGERMNFRLAANFFNALNNHYFVNQGDGPGSAFVTDVAASGNSFGTWNGTVSTSRTIQFEGRFEF